MDIFTNDGRANRRIVIVPGRRESESKMAARYGRAYRAVAAKHPDADIVSFPCVDGYAIYWRDPSTPLSDYERSALKAMAKAKVTPA